MTINDILALGKMGFNAQQVQQFLALEKAQQGQTETAPAQSAAPAAPAAQPPVVPDPMAAMAAMAKQLVDLTASVNALQVPTAGTVGNPPPVTSVEDIIMGLVKPAEAPASPDFNYNVITGAGKGV